MSALSGIHAPGDNAPARSDRRRILLIDDDEDIRTLIALVLEEEGYEVLCAENGINGLHALPSFSPHVILLDIMMPGMDGFEVLERIRALPAYLTTPVIVQSGKNLDRDEEEILSSFGARLLRKDALLSGSLAQLIRTMDTAP